MFKRKLGSIKRIEVVMWRHLFTSIKLFAKYPDKRVEMETFIHRRKHQK